jgi:poly(hydroxyalkanoate) depolymerase family esterase
MRLDSIAETIEQALTAAGLKPRSGALNSVTRTIRDALAGAGLKQRVPPQVQKPETHPTTGRSEPEFVERVQDPEPLRRNASSGPVESWSTHTCVTPAGSRDYRLFIPAHRPNAPMPLLLMLHGCKQNPDDFAAGTRMNEFAERHGFAVAYPAQTARANGASCWNWFEKRDQQRGGGEPEILAGIVREVSARHPIDPHRVFVAGLSAGAAMAVILGETYPELFAGVGVHSGLPYGAASDVATAFSAMRGGMSRWPAHAPDAAPSGGKGVPTIVFHGDVDTTVAPSNGDSVAARAAGGMGLSKPVAMAAAQPAGGSQTVRAHTATVYADRDGNPRVEHWVVHGAAHAWSGGSARGSYTDAKGPDASAEMVRFFLAQ